MDNIIFFLFIFRKIWDAVSGDELHTFSHKHIVKSVDFSRDSKLLLTASQEKKLKIFDLEKHEAGLYGNLCFIKY